MQLKKHTKGFTIIEMMVSVALFSMVILMSVASLMSLIDASQKTRSIRTTMDNLHLVVDSMSRDLRLGSKYYCQTESSPRIVLPSGTGDTKVHDCKYTDGGGQYLAFRDRYGKTGFYRFDGSCLQKKVTSRDWLLDYTDVLTGPDSIGAFYTCQTPTDNISITRFRFYVYNTGSGSNAQPYVVLSIQGKAGSGKTASTFSIMTSISQRIPHNAE